MNRLAFLGVAVLALVWSGCEGLDGDDDDDDGGFETVDCSLETRADLWAVGLAKAGDNGQYIATLVSADPVAPIKGDNSWVVDISDANGQPVSGVTFQVEPFMPDHGHGTSIKAVVTESPTAGQYEFSPVNLPMPGLWEVQLYFPDQATNDERVMFSVCVSG